jgi:predicted glycogen debranching enzyme
MSFDGEYTHAPEWYRHFLYTAERERGLDDTEDLASPGIVSWSMTRSAPVVMLLSAGETSGARSRDDVSAVADEIVEKERARRARFATSLDRAADAYIVRRGGGRTIAAGYPWFTDWGRDTFIAVRGLCLATGRTDVARDILVEWAGAVSDGMLPNRFPDRGETPEFNSVDASLWYVVAVGELLQQTRRQPHVLDAKARRALEDAVVRIVAGYAAGTRYGIRMDVDGLLRAGEPGVQLTWMDARVGDRVITPRIGKPVEVQALWQNALMVASRIDARWNEALACARQSFLDRIWIE